MSEILTISFPPKNGRPISPDFLQRTARLLTADPQLNTSHAEIHRASVPTTITVTIKQVETKNAIEQLLKAQGVLFEFSS